MVCSKCNAQLAEGAVFCANCGTPVAGGAQPQPQAVYVNPSDHTAEFDAKDIADNKIYAMLPYLLSFIGVIITLLGAKESAYANFHVRWALRINVISILLALITAILCWTCIIPIVGGIAAVMIAVIDIICFVQVCQGKAKEPFIIKEFKFL